jgi:hypothetical protein
MQFGFPKILLSHLFGGTIYKLQGPKVRNRVRNQYKYNNMSPSLGTGTQIIKTTKKDLGEYEGMQD